MRIAIIGGGPGGYEAALVAAQLGAEVTLAERDGLGGACVLTDCVPSKTLIETSSTVTVLDGAADLGIRPGDGTGDGAAAVDATRLHNRIKALARAQSADVAARVAAEGVEVIDETACLAGPRAVRVGGRDISADAVLVAVGAHPRVLPDSVPDGERILNWRQLYDLPEIPEELIVVGSGVTGAEFAGAYQSLGSRVTLVSSRERVLPHEDVDAAVVIEEVFRRRGMTILGRSRAASVKRQGDRVVVRLTDGRVVHRRSAGPDVHRLLLPVRQPRRSRPQTNALHPRLRLTVLARGDDPRNPPLRSAPARWYFADTPAAHRAGGPVRWAGMSASP